MDQQNSGKSTTLFYDGEEYFATAFYGLESNVPLRLVAMFPISKIGNESAKLLKNFILIGILSILATVGLSFIVSRSITDPISNLKNGVKELTGRNFKYRLPDLGKNEFGNLAKLFNKTLADMEELEVAGFVQEKLIPQLKNNVVLIIADFWQDRILK